MKYPFKRDPEGGLIVINLTFDDKHEIDMILDTGASHTTVDINSLYQMGYTHKDKIDVASIETANGVIEVEILEVGSLASMGIKRNRFPVQGYDFVAHGVLSDYDGVIGLDFFEGTTFCVDMIENTIAIHVPDSVNRIKT
ncbi:MAG: retroviral-like aspartic protease family protein [Prevotellaceae bacterium]|jgi:hypothetical protein|nr:retroviral-like aspartic protease family protein [Prevotellaceae bacterium]